VKKVESSAKQDSFTTAPSEILSKSSKSECEPLFQENSEKYKEIFESKGKSERVPCDLVLKVNKDNHKLFQE